MTTSAVCRLIPSPPARVERRKINFSELGAFRDHIVKFGFAGFFLFGDHFFGFFHHLLVPLDLFFGVEAAVFDKLAGLEELNSGKAGRIVNTPPVAEIRQNVGLSQSRFANFNNHMHEDVSNRK